MLNKYPHNTSHLKIILMILFITITLHATKRNLHALTLYDIPTQASDSITFAPLYTLLQRLPHITNFVYIDYDDFFAHTALLDSTRSILRASVQICSSVQHKAPYQANLYKGTLLHMLDQLHEDYAGTQSDSIFLSLRTAYPESMQATWFHALRNLENGHLYKGLRMLDSVATTNPQQATFWKSYALNAYTALIPTSAKIPPISIFTQPATDTTLSDSLRREQPHLNTWNIVRDDTCHTLPSFMYRISLSLLKKWDRNFIAQQGQATSVRSATSMAPQYLSSFFLNKMFFKERRTTSDIYVVIDLNNTTELLETFIQNHMPPTYDSIIVAHTPPAQNSFSITCMQRHAKPDIYGSYVTMTGLKRYLVEGTIVSSPQPDSQTLKINYLLMLVSCKEDRKRTAPLFKQISETFLK